MAQTRTAPKQRQAAPARQKKMAHAQEPKKWTHGAFYWNELNTHDVEAAKRFYADTLGWHFEPMPMPEGMYWIIKSGETLVGGLFEMTGPAFANAPEMWLGYIAVDDIDARVKTAVAAGAKVMRPAWDIPGVGRMAILMEPGGAGIAWMTPAS